MPVDRARLGLDVARRDDLALVVEGNLAADEHEVADAPALRDRRPRLVAPAPVTGGASSRCRSMAAASLIVGRGTFGPATTLR